MLPGALTAQPGRWDVGEITYGGDGKFGTRVAIDQWGHSHLIWGSRATWGVRGNWGQDLPGRAGIQLFYTSDATGKFSSPIQVTDTTSGSVYLSDSLNTPWVFRLDVLGGAHVAYVANKDNRPSLFYISNADDMLDRKFSIAQQLADLPPLIDTLGFDMAVDSAGVAHIVWLDRWIAGQPKLIYWNSLTRIDTVLEHLRADGRGGCTYGVPEIEIGPGGRVNIAFRVLCGGIGSIRLVRQNPNGVFRYHWLETQPYGNVLEGEHQVDLRLRMASDADGHNHIITPYFRRESHSKISYQLLYVFAESEAGIAASGQDVATIRGDAHPVTTSQLDTVPGDFDLTYNHARRLEAVWSTRRAGKRTQIAYAEFAPAGGFGWATTSTTSDLNNKFARKLAWHSGVRVASSGDRVVIGANYEASPIERVQQVGTISRSSLRPRIRYMLPDAAAPGMSVVVETYAHPRERGSFGPDTLIGNVSMELAQESDSSRVVVGPSVVSWDGRLVSTMLFVKGGAVPGAVPLRLRVGNELSNVDTFFVVVPHQVGELSGGGVIGKGARSRRGVLVIDSMILKSGTYRFDTTDWDPETPGNQGFLPVTVLSRGPISIEATAVLSVSASTRPDGRTAAGPGGGGGGSGGELEAGSGFTGGGGISRTPGGWLMGMSNGSGSIHSGIWNGGGALNGTPGGATYVSAPSGGGTAHPFGVSGLFGKVSSTEPVSRNEGGNGGGTAGALHRDGRTTGGGGGGNASAGVSGGDKTDGEKINGGRVVGSRQIVPLAGGSGGGGGASATGKFSNGGSGGGALQLISFAGIRIDGRVEANGSEGADRSRTPDASGGGGGAGGGLLIGAQGGLTIGSSGSVTALGGNGGKGGVNGDAGGDGGKGRIRIDGRVDRSNDATIDPPIGYTGPGSSMGRRFSLPADSLIMGYGTPDSVVRLYKKTELGPWVSSGDIIVGKDGIWRHRLRLEERMAQRLYVAVMQRVSKPSSTDYEYEPSWVLSPAGGILIGRPKLAISRDSLAFPCIRFDEEGNATIEVENSGEISNLRITDIRITGRDSARFRVEPNVSQLEVEAGRGLSLRVVFSPDTVGDFQAELVLKTNDMAESERRIALTGCAVTGRLLLDSREIDLGELCVGECRPRTITVRNNGEAPLTLGSITSAIGDVSITDVLPRLPLTVKSGDSMQVTLRLCMNRFVPDGTELLFRSNTLDPTLSVLVRGVNAQPQPKLPAEAKFAMVDLSSGEPCVTTDITIGNGNGEADLLLRNLVLADPRFTIINAPPAGSRIAPGDSVTISVRFCADAPGRFDVPLQLFFGTDDCGLDAAIVLRGEALQSLPVYILESPASKSLDFGMVPLRKPSGLKVAVRNRGEAPGGAIDVTSSHPAFAPASAQIPGLAVDAPGEVEILFTPTVAGQVDGMLYLRSRSNPVWRDSVKLSGTGVQPSVEPDRTRIDFDETCVGDRTAPREVKLYNLSKSPVHIDAIALQGDDFAILSSHTPPVDLAPGEAVTLTITFQPDASGVADGAILVNGVQVVDLKGTGAEGHLTIDRTDLYFGCIANGRDTTLTVTLRNPSACPVEVQDLRIDGGREFSVTPAGPVTIDGGGQQQFTLRYTAGSAASAATLTVISSAPEMLSAALRGDVCRDEIKISLALPDTSAVVGDAIVLPITAEVTPFLPLSQPIQYTVTLTYAYDLLAPRLAPRADAPGVEFWTLGTLTEYDPQGYPSITERSVMDGGKRMGELTISGTIGTNRTSATLLNIPFKVLLGSTYFTELKFKTVTLSSGEAFAKGGTFQALDCDTLGGVVLTGIYALKQNVPNPFNPSTVITYDIARQGHVSLVIYDAMGNLVRTLVDEVQPAGRHEFRLDATSLSSGMYTYVLVSGDYRKALPMMLAD